MPAKQYSVMLEQDQRESLIGLISTGNRDAARKLTRARILLKADEGEFGPAYTDEAIKAAVEVSASTIQRVRKTFVREGLKAALTPKKPSKPSRPKKFDGEKEAHLKEEFVLMKYGIYLEPRQFLSLGFPGPKLDIGYLPDSTCLVVLSSIGMQIYDAQTRKELNLPARISNRVFGVAFSPNGTTLATLASRENKYYLTEVHLWRVARDEEPKHLLLPDQDYSAYAIAFSPDSTVLAIGNTDGEVQLWHVPTGTKLKTLKIKRDYWITSVAFSPDGTTFLANCHSYDKRDYRDMLVDVIIRSRRAGPQYCRINEVQLWSVATGKKLKNLIRERKEGSPSSPARVVFSPDGTTFVGERFGEMTHYGGYDGLYIRHVVTGKELKPLKGDLKYRLGDALGIVVDSQRPRLWIPNIAFSPDGITFASVNETSKVDLRYLATGEKLRTLPMEGPHGSANRIISVAFSPDGTTLASVSQSSKVDFWDMATGEKLRTLPMEGPHGSANRIISVAFSPDGTTLASVSQSSKVDFWDLLPANERVL